ncbi:MAG: YfiH family protein [Bermanella sp.]|jgi:YfiH family protein|nr:MAG: laccase [Cycloclasticus sp. Phe_18]
MDFITPDWPVPERVKAISTRRHGGISEGPYSSLNLANHVGDDDRVVTQNRSTLFHKLQLPAKPVWLEQVHGTRVMELGQHEATQLIQADASISRNSDFVCAVMTADCLPILLCKEDGSAVAAVHAGWRGLVAGIVEKAVTQLAEPEKIIAWLGPAIGPSHFEVGAEVKEAFVNKNSVMRQCFQQIDSQHYLADLYALARIVLLKCGVKRIYGGEYCTYNQADQFFSYRREPITGRMASLIWLQP